MQKVSLRMVTMGCSRRQDVITRDKSSSIKGQRRESISESWIGESDYRRRNYLYATTQLGSDDVAQRLRAGRLDDCWRAG